MKKKIADIYLRVSSPVQNQGDGFRRQEEVCRKWCEDNKINIRNVIKDICSAFTGEHIKPHRPLGQAFDRYRKGYWDNKGEPLDENECNKEVIGETPPDFLVFESVDRFSRLDPLKSTFLILIQGGIGIRFVFVADNIITNL